MSRNIDEVSIFGEYKQSENRLTAAFLQILKIGGEELIREIAHTIGFNIPSSEIEISTQVKEEESVPDGQLECNFAFCLYIESKVGKLNDQKQLANHMKLIKSDERRTLLYITGDDQRPSFLPKKCHWTNWEGTITTFSKYIADTQINNYELLSFMVDQYETLLNNIVYKKRKWAQVKDKVIILAGSIAEGIAITYGYYICQNGRQFQNAEYVAFFKNNVITRLFRIDGEPTDDVDLRDIGDLKEYLERERPHYLGEKAKIMKLKDMEILNPITNDSVDKNGNPCPYTYGQPRYTTLEPLKAARKTSEL